MRLLLILIFSISMIAISQEDPSRENAPGVSQLTVIKVKTNYFNVYLYGL